jgi:hypothetical protein
MSIFSKFQNWILGVNNNANNHDWRTPTPVTENTRVLPTNDSWRVPYGIENSLEREIWRKWKEMVKSNPYADLGEMLHDAGVTSTDPYHPINVRVLKPQNVE